MEDNKKNYGQWFLGVFAKPKETFAAIVEKSDVLKPLLILMGVSLAVALLSLPKAQQLALWTIDNMPQYANLPPEQLAKAREMVGVSTTIGLIAAVLAGVPLICTIQAAAVKFFGQFLSWGAPFKEVFKLSVYAYAVTILRDLIRTVLFWLTPVEKAMSISTSLTLLVPQASNAWWYSMLGKIDVFTIWNLVVLSIGLGVLFKEDTKHTAGLVFFLWAAYVIIAVILGQVFNLPTAGNLN